MSILKFAVNTPVRVALSYPTGKEFAGKFGPRVLFSLCLAPAGERSMYLPPIAAEQIAKLGIVQGEPFQIVKATVPNVGRPKIEWQVSRIETKHAERETNPAAAETKPAAAETKPQQTGHATKNGVPYRDPKAEWLRCADEAVEVLVTARAHAAAKGLPVQFSGEDVRVVASTLYIGRGQDRRASALR
jgi:hypothetical protein